MLTPHELWWGPVNGHQVPLATAGGPRTFMTCTGDGDPTCGQQADALADPQGRHLPNLMARLGLPPDQEVVGACFSAGGSAWKRILVSPQDRQQVRALHLADGTYTHWQDGAPAPAEGFVLYGLDALAGDRLFVATASASPNRDLPNGVQSLLAIEQEITRRSGVAFQDVEAPPGMPPAARVATAGGVMFMYYPEVPHGEQVTRLGPLAWQHVIAPWLAGVRPAGPAPSAGVPATAEAHEDALVLAAVAVAGAAVAYAIVRALGGRA